MRIGILTFHSAINYGAYLQAFSLSNMMQSAFPDDEVEIVDYTAPKEARRKAYIVLRNLKHHGIKGAWSELNRIRIFMKAQKHLSLSPKHFCMKRLEHLYEYIEERYDVLIIGSDAVFNWNQTNFPTAYIPEYRFSVPVYTYAASVHGLRFYEADKAVIRKCGEAFERMRCIGVRDDCSAHFVKYCAPDAKTVHCCDPTLFIDTSQVWELGCGVVERAKKEYKFSLNSKYIVIMAPDSALAAAVADRYRGEYKIVSVFVKNRHSDIYMDDLNPFEWAVVLRNAALVVTSYFHGTLLALVQGTPVLSVDYSEYSDLQYESKLKDLMVRRLSLPEFYIEQKDVNSLVESDAWAKRTDLLLSGVHDRKIAEAISQERANIQQFVERINSEIRCKQ